jgi:Arc/MetJ-type ribon-helix-helix transcriptional regulator
MVTKMVAVKLTETELRGVIDLINLGRFETVSAALRAGLMLLFDEQHLKFEARLKIRQERIVHRLRKAKHREEGR